MSFALTIPQAVYDVIARVIPGFYFFLLSRLLLPAIHGRLFGYGTPSQGVAAAADALAFVAGFYLAGWFLHGLALLVRVPAWLRPPAPEDLFRQHDELRLKKEEVGYRILKLRAEASMLETCIIGTALVFVVDIIATIANWFGGSYASISGIATRIAIYALLLPALRAAYCAAWTRYYGVVKLNHELVFGVDAIDALRNGRM